MAATSALAPEHSHACYADSGYPRSSCVCRKMIACGTSYALKEFQCRSRSARNNPRVRPCTSLGMAVVIALIDEPDGPKLIVEANANRGMLEIQGVCHG